MSQRSITSFFQVRGTTNKSNGTPDVSSEKKTEDSNDIIKKKRKRIQALESDSEDESVTPVKSTDKSAPSSRSVNGTSSASVTPVITGKKKESELKNSFQENEKSSDSKKKKRKRSKESSEIQKKEKQSPLQDVINKSKNKNENIESKVKVEFKENGSADERQTINEVSTTPIDCRKTYSRKGRKKSVDVKTKAVESDSPKHTKSPEPIEQNKSPEPTKQNKSPALVKQNDSGLKMITLSGGQYSVINGVDYNPGKTGIDYHPIDDAFWKIGQSVPYLALARTFRLIEQNTGRLKIIETLSNYFRSVLVLSQDDLLPSIYLCLNKLGPAYEAAELGVADTYLMKAIAQCTGRSMAQIKSDLGEIGDLGIVAEQSRSNQRMMFQPAPLTIQSVFKKLKEISLMSGNAAMSKKVDLIQSLFVACKDCEARYLIRSLAGKLRIGLAENSVLQALALACVTTPPGQEYPPKKLNVALKMAQNSFKQLVADETLILRTTFCECPDYNIIIPVLLKDGIKALPEQCKLTPGIPPKPMLAQPTKGVQEVLTRFEGLKFTCEYKYDGERAQIHILENGEIKIYSRNQEDNTSKYPDIISNLKTVLADSKIESCILDSEAVAWDRENKRIMPFQILSTRKRKDASEDDIKVQVCVFMFDLLYLNGRPLVQETLNERRRLLKEHFKELEEKFAFAKHLDTNTMEEVQEFLEESVKSDCEGLMVKTLEEEATYEIAKRSRNWLKLKKDYLDGVGDTLDLVVIGGYLGKGKRTGTYGGFLLACYDPENEEYQSICKIGTGFSDESLSKHTEFFKDHVIPNARPYYRYDTSHEPDHWFDAVQVWEIKCADLSLSPVHRAGIGIVDAEKGISLRFPRYLRTRTDKSVEESTASHQVAELYRNQDQIKNQAKTSLKPNEEDFY